MKHPFTLKNNANNFNSLEGKVLISTPMLDGSIFERALIYVCSHGVEGAIGVVFNKPINSINSKEIIASNKIKKLFHLNKKFTVFYGGPIEANSNFILSASQEQRKLFSKNHSLTLYTNAEGFLKDVVKGKNKDNFLIIKGFCGWAARQLETEIAENSWILTIPNFRMIFGSNSTKKWNEAVKRIGIKSIQQFKDLVSYTGQA
jgi:putative transcriptional regulator